MTPHPYEWGWRIRCSHDGCSNSHSVFQPVRASGPPPMQAKVEGWYRYRVEPGYWDRSPLFIHLCPEHASIGQEYEERRAAWEAARRAEALRYREVLKAGLQTVMGHMRSLWDDVRGRTGQDHLNCHMQGWLIDNPPPTKPWEG